MPLVIVFRVDLLLEIGSGYVMRCLTLATALQQIGAVIHFICRDLPSDLIEVIREHGFFVHVLVKELTSDSELTNASELKYASWLGVSQQQDAELSEANVVLLEDKSFIRERIGKFIDELLNDDLKTLSIESARLVDGMGVNE